MRLRPQGLTQPAHKTSENNWIASFLHFPEHFVAKLLILTCLIWNLYKCEHWGDIFGLEVFRPSDLSLYFFSGASLSFSLSYMCFILFVCFAVCMGGHMHKRDEAWGQHQASSLGRSPPLHLEMGPLPPPAALPFVPSDWPVGSGVQLSPPHLKARAPGSQYHAWLSVWILGPKLGS